MPCHCQPPVQETNELCFTGRMQCPGALRWPTAWFSKRSVLHWVWTAAKYVLQEQRPSPKILWSTSWAWTSLWWRFTAWVKARAHTPSPWIMLTDLQGQQHKLKLLTFIIHPSSHAISIQQSNKKLFCNIHFHIYRREVPRALFT